MTATFAEVTATLLAAGRDPYLVYDRRQDETLTMWAARNIPEDPRPDRWSILQLPDGVVVTYVGGHRVTSVADLPDAVPFPDASSAYGWALEQAMTTPDLRYRVLGRSALDPRLRTLLDEHAGDAGTFLGLPWPARGWRLARVEGRFELHHLGLPGLTHGVVLADPELVELEKVLLASLAPWWRDLRPWRWPGLQFNPARAPEEQWRALRESSLGEVIAAAGAPDGGGILATTGQHVPEDLVTDAIYDRAAPHGLDARCFADGSTTSVHLGSGMDRSHFLAIRHPGSPRYELIELGERSNEGPSVLRTDDPSALEAELLRRI